ncbi:MAG: pyrroline-5-carboxylate reductase [Betaproteobacteria bacterium]|nr:pyrroline-5-carboxylate reductase [Betaproteobacteria bacterium]
MKVTFVGGGNMANALIAGMISRGFAAFDVQVIEVVPGARTRLSEQFGVRCVAAAREFATLGDIVVMAVKPQQMRDAAGAIAKQIGTACVLSIAAGITLNDLSRWLGGSTSLLRCMPNTPALIGEGITAVYAQPAVNAAARTNTEVILAPAGKIVWVDAEALLDPVTAISGSGPAYVFYFIEAMQAAAVELGLSPATARALVLQTFRGATELATRSDESPAQLRARVTSKGGTTEEALASFEHDRIKEAIRRGIHAANRRAAELAEQFGKGA